MHHYPFHLGDYLKSTAHLSAMEDLAYRRLLDMYYDTEAPIPNETQWVARRLRMDSELIANVLREFFEPSEHGWKHARCEAEIAKYRKRCEANKSNGIKGGRKQKPKRNPMGSESVANGFQTKNQEPVSKPPIPPEGDFVPGLNLEAWNRWMQYRTDIRKPIKPASILAAQRKLAGYGNGQAVAVEQSIANGWTGLFEPKTINGAKPVEWWSSDSATEAKGRELGLSPRAGEGWPQFRDRIRAKLSERAHA